MLIVTSYENMTLCHDRCVSGCVSYRVPLGTCFSPPQLWPGDPQWGDNDVLDECTNASYFRRSFYSSLDGSCVGKTGGFELPIGDCVGPFGKPRPWGSFNLSCGAEDLPAWYPTPAQPAYQERASTA
jgi:hypothetical protein